jgi:hypothetical protein
MRLPATWLRLSVLLALLSVATLGLLDTHGLLSTSAGSGGATPERGCRGRMAPHLASVSPTALRQMQATALAVLPRQAGAPYEQGVIDVENLWSDNRPSPVAATGGGARHGAYEVRWWALDAEGRQDDVVVDVLAFGGSQQADLALAAAADPRCHGGAAGSAATLPPGARLLSWVNPDGANEQDALLVRGRFLYRVADAPPGVGGDLAQRAREHDRVATLTEVLACSLPRAGCPAGALATAAASAGAPASPPQAETRSWPGSAAQAATYARASLRHTDLPYMAAVGPASGDVRAQPAWFSRCLGDARSPSIIAGATSPRLGFRRRLVQQSAQSETVVLASEAAAARYVAAISRAFAGPCARNSYARALARARRSHPRLRLTQLQITPLPSAAPDSYRGSWPWRAVAVRVSVEALVTGRRGRVGRLSYSQAIFAFAYRRAVVELSITSTGAPVPEASRQYVESALVGLAQARWGRG